MIWPVATWVVMNVAQFIDQCDFVRQGMAEGWDYSSPLQIGKTHSLCMCSCICGFSKYNGKWVATYLSSWNSGGGCLAAARSFILADALASSDVGLTGQMTDDRPQLYTNSARFTLSPLWKFFLGMDRVASLSVVVAFMAADDTGHNVSWVPHCTRGLKNSNHSFWYSLITVENSGFLIEHAKKKNCPKRLKSGMWKLLISEEFVKSEG